MKKKLLGILLSVAMVGTLLGGCGGSAGGDGNGSQGEAAEAESTPAAEPAETEAAEPVKVESAQVSTGGYQINTGLDLETPVELDITGPGMFQNEEETTNLVTGVTVPGYNVIAERWSELYPNVKLNFNITPWDDWQSAITTACLDGNADIIMHGATMVDMTEDLRPWLDKEPEYEDQLYALASRRTSDNPGVYKVSGISIYTAPVCVWVDKEKFEHFGVDLPEDGWTIEEFKEIAEKMTGTDPVTGEEVYGILLPFSGTGNLFFNHMLMAYVHGAQIFEYGDTLKDCKVNYTSEESVQAFQTIADLAQFESPEAKEGAAVSLSLDGKNNWAMLPTNNTVNDYLLLKSLGLEDKYAIYNLPVIEKGPYAGNPSPYFGDINIAMYKDSDQKEWVWEFIKFLTTDEVATQWVVDQLVYPNNKNAIDAVREMLDERTLEVMSHAMATMPENFNGSTNDNFNNVSFGPVTNNLITAVDDVINGRATAEEAAQFMQDIVDEYLQTVE